MAVIGSAVRAFVDWQRSLSEKFDKLFPEKFRRVGILDFEGEVLPLHLVEKVTIYDVGGGSRPCLTLEQKKALGIRLVGVDISAEELDKAPAGVYDEIVVADITKYRGRGDADLIVCRATLEHVRNTDGAFACLASILKPGGQLLLVVPSRNAIFARINLILPEKVKRAILFSIFPHKALGHDGFPAFYNQCTPRDFRRLADRHGMDVEFLKPYYYSSYFSFFIPFFILWRLWVVAFAALCGEQAAEVFSMKCIRR